MVENGQQDIEPLRWARYHRAAPLIAFAVFALAYLGLTRALASTGSGPWPLALLYTLASVVPVALCVPVIRRAEGAERRAWFLLTLAVGSFVLGDVAWTLHQTFVDTAGPTLASFSGLAFAVGYMPLLGYVVLIVRTALVDVPGLSRARILVELSIAMVLGTAIVFVAFVAPAYEGGFRLGAGDALINAGFAVLNLFIVIALTGILLESGVGVWRRWESKVALALLIVSVADLVSHPAEVAGVYRLGTMSGSLIDLLWLSAYFVFATAALQRLRLPAELTALPALTQGRRRVLRWYDLAMPLLLLGIAPFALFQARYGTMGDGPFWVLTGAAIILMVLVLVRSVLLTAEYGALMNHSVIDALTGAYNHRYFHERLGVEVDRARRSGEALSLVLLDIDDFAAVNEEHGHSHGDQCLRSVSALLRRIERPADTLCRLGSDEFGIIMPLTQSHEASLRIAAALNEIGSDRDIDGCIGSVSVGVASFPQHAAGKADLLRKADGALYWAQSKDRGAIVVYDDSVVEALSPDQRIRMAEEQSYMNTVEALAAAVDARDSYTQFHSRHVSALATVIARRLGLAENHVRLIGIAGLLHDVGKIGVPDALLRKSTALTPEERLLIQEHPELGERILSATIFHEILPWVSAHHEHWDGQGYPRGIAGEEIPLEARILSVCDAFDAMVSDRPYRPGLPFEFALDELRREAGRQFDMLVVHAFMEMVDAGQVPPEALDPERIGNGSRSVTL